MKKYVSLLLCFLMIFSLAGCGGNSKEDTSTYTYSSELDIKNLDSSDADDQCSLRAIRAVIDGLMKTNKKGNITYGIAKSEEVSEDGLTHTYKLRIDAKWANGDPVTANDFVYAWHRIFKNKGNYYYMFADGIASIQGAQELSDKIDAGEELTDDDLNSMGVKALDDYTLEVKTTVRVSFLDELLAFPPFYPINEKFAEKQGNKYGKSAKTILGNGAFTMTNWEPGSVAEFEKNESYYDQKHVKLNKLVMKLVQEPKVAAQSFEAGETDYAPINSDLVDKYKDDEAFKQVYDGFLFYISVNFQNSDLANLNVRKAISLAINRKDLCENVLKDGSQVAGGFIPSGLATNPDGVDFRKDSGNFTSYDKKKAQESLEEGLKELGKDQITLRITYGTDESPMDVFATYLQNALSKLDAIKVEMVATTKQDRIYNKQKNGDFDLAVTRWGPDYGDPTTYLTIALSTNSNNYGKWSNSEYDQLVGQVGVESDVNKRWQEMKDAEKILLDDYAYIPVFEKGAATLQNPKVKNLVIKPCRTISFEYVEKTE
ncbi:peptide ABC transporter substrate-binding protein [Faecalibacillus faecis]|uniref:peptide ABC transporter substrate-binding protein n=1 Tax=Faecalibacillus faecis TaxID=1982628 RepID=UPI0022E392FA|nr:peptide ABC transporter substrate-binding protein [Faecalibacillus faecis]